MKLLCRERGPRAAQIRPLTILRTALLTVPVLVAFALLGHRLLLASGPARRGPSRPRTARRRRATIGGGWPLTSYQVIISAIAATSTRTRLKVHARLDDNEYPKVDVTDEQLAAVNITRDAFHPEWNYTINTSTN